MTVSSQTAQTWRARFPQEQGGPVIPPDTGFPLRRLLRLAGLRWRYSNPPPHGAWRRSLGVGLPSGAHDQILSLSDDCEFLDAGRPLWREHGPIIYLYNCFWALSEQSLCGPSPVDLTSIFCCLIWGPGSRIYIPLKQGGPVIAPGTGFPLRRLLWLVGLQWMYSNPISTRRSLITQSQSRSHVTTDG
jgi:hypothetical protein